MRKEILTDDKIKLDIIDGSTNIRKIRLFYAVLLSVLNLAILVILFTRGAWYGYISLILPLGWIVKHFVSIKRSKNVANNNEYFVLTDEVTSVIEDYENVHVPGRNKIIIVHFSNGNEWLVPGRNYEWSELYHMSDEGIYNTSLIGDTFYVVQYRSNGNVAVAYNAKFFDYKK